MQVPILARVQEPRLRPIVATDLAVIVTPYVVRSVAPEAVVPAGRSALRMERIPGPCARPAQPDLRVAGKVDPAHVQPELGFILD